MIPLKVAITGHTSGLGEFLFNQYQMRGHEVHGFSRSNGFDLDDAENIKRVTEACTTCDVIINNAPGIFQRDLFLALVDRIPKDRRSVIANISSVASRFTVSRSIKYASDKAALDLAVLSHQHIGGRWPAALLFRFGYMQGERSRGKPEPKLPVPIVGDQIMQAVDYTLSDLYRVNEITITA